MEIGPNLDIGGCAMKKDIDLLNSSCISKFWNFIFQERGNLHVEVVTVPNPNHNKKKNISVVKTFISFKGL